MLGDIGGLAGGLVNRVAVLRPICSIREREALPTTYEFCILFGNVVAQ